MITLYGIANCDTVRKAKKWLETHNLAYQFHDFRKDGLDQKTIETWLQKVDLNTLVNKRSTTWKQLSDEEKTALMEQGQIEILLQHPTLIKRPVLVKDDQILVGFKEELIKSLELLRDCKGVDSRRGLQAMASPCQKAQQRSCPLTAPPEGG